MNNKTKKYEPATDLYPLNWDDVSSWVSDEYEEDDIQALNELRIDAHYHLARLFVNNILKIDESDADAIINEINNLLFTDKSFQDIEKIIRKQFNIK
jgi:hypothetical protein